MRDSTGVADDVTQSDNSDSSSPTRFDVVVIGGGFAGLAAGVSLGARGFRVALLEGKPEDEVFTDEEEAKPPEAPAVEEKGTAREGARPRPRPVLRSAHPAGWFAFPLLVSPSMDATVGRGAEGSLSRAERRLKRPERSPSGYR